MARVLIAGCGDVGTVLGLRLADAGHEVWGLRRRAEPLPEPLRTLRADLTHLDDLHGLPSGLEAVFYTAAPEGGDEEAYIDAYVLGVRNLLEALRETGQSPRRVLLTSSTSVYAQRGGEWVDETSPAEPERAQGRRILEGERLLHDGPFEAVVARMGGIYGPDRTRLLDRVRQGHEAPHTGGPLYTNRVHIEDCAGILAHLMDLPGPEPLYLGVDHEPAERNDLLRFLAEGLGVDLPPPEPPSAMPAGRGLTNKRCRNRLIVDSGYSFRYPTYREGYTALLWEERG